MIKLNIMKFRQNMSETLHKVAFNDERVILCKNNKQMAVMISWDDWKVVEAMFRENDKLREMKG